MRTDKPSLSAQAAGAAKQAVRDNFGDEYVRTGEERFVTNCCCCDGRRFGVIERTYRSLFATPDYPLPMLSKVLSKCSKSNVEKGKGQSCLVHVSYKKCFSKATERFARRSPRTVPVIPITK